MWTCVSAFLEGGFESSQGDFDRCGGECIFYWLMSAGESMMGANYSGAASIVEREYYDENMGGFSDAFHLCSDWACFGCLFSVKMRYSWIGRSDNPLTWNSSQCGASYSVAAAVLLASISTAVVGSISFLGLLVPHIARLLVGNSHKVLIPYTMLLGAFTLLLADTIGRTIAYPYEINAAVVMAVIGGT